MITAITTSSSPIRRPLAINNLQPASPPPSLHRTVAFTTPNNYARRLSTLLVHRQFTPLWCPTVIVDPTPSTRSNLLRHLSNLDDFSAVAFTSRTGISAFFSAALSDSSPPPLSPSTGETFTIAALGNDAELLTEEFMGRLCGDSGRVRVLVPETSTPSGLVEALGPGLGKRVLCPVPRVSGLEEPDVVPGFLRELGLMGWEAVRVDAYETRWAGPKCAERLVGDGLDVVDALVFTSTAEVEGLLKGLGEIGLSFDELRRRWPGLVVAAHGPVTAKGAERLGVRVDVVSERFGSFDGVVEALARTWENSSSVV